MTLRGAFLVLGLMLIGVSPPTLALEPGSPGVTVTFEAADGITINGDWFEAEESRATILLFHQGGSNARGEYSPIIPRLLVQDFSVLAIDQRSGGQRYGYDNRTVKQNPGDASYCDAAADLLAALEFAKSERPQDKLILWGSSYSAALAIRLAAARPADVSGVLAFSPASGGPMAECRGDPFFPDLRMPVLLLRPASEAEMESVAGQMQAARSYGHNIYVATAGHHGSSMLVEERVGEDVADNWRRVEAFLDLLVLDAPKPSDRLAVVSRAENRLAFIDLASGIVTSSVPTGRNPHEVTIDPGGNFAYVPAYGGNRVARIDVRTERLVSDFDVPDQGAMHSAAWMAGALWVTSEKRGALLKLDPVSGEILESYSTGGDMGHMVAALPSTGQLVVANMNSGTVNAIDAQTGKHHIVHSGAGPEGIDATPDGRSIWVSNRENNTISIIDVREYKVRQTISSQGEFPVKLRIRPDGQDVWVANNRSASVAVFDAETLEHKTSIDVGSRPLGITFSEDSTRAYVSRPGAAQVLEISTQDYEILRTLDTPRSPDGMVYLAAP